MLLYYYRFHRLNASVAPDAERVRFAARIRRRVAFRVNR